MAKIIESRVKETSTTTGTGDLTLAGAATNFKTFASVCSVGDTFEYFIEDATNSAWEAGLGIYSATNTLKRLIPIRSTNSNALVNFSAGTKNVWIDSGALTLKNRPDNGFFACWNQPDAVTGGGADNGGYRITSSGGSLSASPAVVAGIVGGITLNCTTSTTGRVAFNGINQSGVTSFVPLGGGVARFKARLKMVTLSNGTDTYTARLGFNGSTSGEAVNFVGFRYTDGVNTGKWQAVTKAASVETATDTGVTAQTSTLSTFEVIIDAAAANAYFYIDGVLVATNTTNIPTGASQPVGYGVSVNKSAGSNAIDTLNIYFMNTEYYYTTPF